MQVTLYLVYTLYQDLQTTCYLSESTLTITYLLSININCMRNFVAAVDQKQVQGSGIVAMI